MPTGPTTSSRPPAYLPRKANDLILAGEWNEIQIQAREEIHSHDHSGGEKGVLIGSKGIQPGAINGTHLDTATKATVTELTVTNTFKVGTRTLLTEVDGLVSRVTSLESKVSALENTKVNRGGDTITGTLTLKGELKVEGLITGRTTRPLREQMVHRRIIFGLAGDHPIDFNHEWTRLQPNGILTPFGPTHPEKQPNARRKYRLYGIYMDDNVRTHLGDDNRDGKNEVRIELVEWNELFRSNPTVVKQLIVTLRGTAAQGQGSQMHRDGFSEWIMEEDVSGGLHALLSIRTQAWTKDASQTPILTTGILRYLEIQAWDFFE